MTQMRMKAGFEEPTFSGPPGVFILQLGDKNKGRHLKVRRERAACVLPKTRQDNRFFFLKAVVECNLLMVSKGFLLK